MVYQYSQSTGDGDITYQYNQNTGDGYREAGVSSALESIVNKAGTPNHLV